MQGWAAGSAEAVDQLVLCRFRGAGNAGPGQRTRCSRISLMEGLKVRPTKASRARKQDLGNFGVEAREQP